MKGFLAFFLVAIISFGCVGKGGAPQDLSTPKPTPMPVMAPVPVPDVALMAFAQGNTVFIHIKNNTQNPLPVSPYFFALFIDNKRPEIRFHPSLAGAELPVTRLSKGMEVSGRIRFFNYDNLVGQKIIFNSPDYKPIMTFIEEYIAE